MASQQFHRVAIRSLAVAAAAGLLSLACGSGSNGGNQTGGAPVKVAGILSQTGVSQLFGTDETAGAQFAFDEANSAGGVDGHKIEFAAVNDNTDPTTAVQEFRGIVADEANVAIVGPTSSSVSAALKAPVTQASISMVSPVSASALTNPISPYVFRCFVIDVVATQAVLKFMSSMNVKTVALIHSDDAFGNSAATSFTSAAAGSGLQIVANLSYPPDATNMTTQAIQAKSKNPDGYLAWDATTRLATVLTNMSQQGISAAQSVIVAPPIAGNASTKQVAGAAIDGVYFEDQLASDDPRSGAQATFVQAWQKKFNANPSSANLLGYQAAQIIIKGIDAAAKANKPINRQNVRDGIESIKNASMAYATITFSATDHDGVQLGQVQINQIKAGKNVRAGTA